MMATNPNTYSQSNKTDTATLSQIEDGVDFPHSGLIKALGDGLGQNYAISGFNVTSDSASQIDVTAGVILRDGKRHEVALSNNMALTTTYTNGYHLLVATSATPPVLALRPPTSSETNTKVPQITDGDTIIAMVTYTGVNPCHVQYLTVDKEENSISIARSNSGTYTEEGTITAASGGGIDIVTIQSNEDIRITPDGTGKVVIDGLNHPTSDGSNGDLLQTNGSGDLSFVARSSITLGNHLTVSGNFTDVADKSAAYKRLVGNATLASPTTLATDDEILIRDISETNVEVKPKTTTVQDILDLVSLKTIEDADGDTKIQVEKTSDEDKIHFNTGGTTRMLIDDAGNVGIGTTSPANTLHLSDSEGGEPTVLVENTGTSTTEPELVFLRSGTVSASMDIGHIKFKADNDASTPEEITYAGIFADAATITDGSERGRIIFELMANGTAKEFLRFDAFNIIFNEFSNDINFRVEGNGDTHLIYGDAGTDKVGIGVTAPDYKLDVDGSVRRKGNVQSVTTVAGNALGPPPVMLYNILDTDDVILASAPSGTPPNNLTLHLPDATGTDIGRTYRIIATDATNTLSLERTGSTDAIHGADDVALTLPYSLTGGKIYDVICVADNKWMLLQLN